jgi:hypothetical protein
MATDRTAERSPAASGERRDRGTASATEGPAERKGEDPRPRNDRGQYVDRMTESEILDLLERLPGPVIASTDVAEHFDSTTEGARRKLDGLCDSGRLDRRKVGGTSVYWRPEGGEA